MLLFRKLILHTVLHSACSEPEWGVLRGGKLKYWKLSQPTSLLAPISDGRLLSKAMTLISQKNHHRSLVYYFRIKDGRDGCQITWYATGVQFYGPICLSYSPPQSQCGRRNFKLIFNKRGDWEDTNCRIQYQYLLQYVPLTYDLEIDVSDSDKLTERAC